MYSKEIEGFLRERNNVVSPEECKRIIDITVNPQIKNVKYFCFDNRFVVETDDNYTFVFWMKS